MKDNGEEIFFDSTEKFLRGAAGVLVFLVGAFVVVSMLVCASGCATARIGTDSGKIRESDAYVIGQLDQSLEEFDRGIRNAVNRSRGMESEIQRLNYLFGEYEQAALRLRDEVREIRDREKNAKEIGGDTVNR